MNVYSEEQEDSEATDMHYAFSGYAALSIRIIQNSFKPGWEVKDDLLGPQDRHNQPLPQGVQERTNHSTRNHVTLVYFVGGVTYAEISLLRWLSKQEGQSSLYDESSHTVQVDFMEISLSLLPS